MNIRKLSTNSEDIKLVQQRLLEILIEVDKICKRNNIQYWIDSGSTLGAVRHGGFIPWDDDIDIAVMKEDYNKLLTVLENELPKNLVLQNIENEKTYHMMYSRVVDLNSRVFYDDEIEEIRKDFNYQGLFLDLFYIEKGNVKFKKIIEKFYFMSFRMSQHPYKRNLFVKIAAKIVRPFSILFVWIIRKLSFLINDNHLIFGYGIPYYDSFRKFEILPTKPITFEGIEFPGPNNPDAYLQRYYGDYKKLPPLEQRETHTSRVELYYPEKENE